MILIVGDSAIDSLKVAVIVTTSEPETTSSTSVWDNVTVGGGVLSINNLSSLTKTTSSHRPVYSFPTISEPVTEIETVPVVTDDEDGTSHP